MRYKIIHEMVGPFRCGDVVEGDQFPFGGKDATRNKANLDRLIGMSAIANVPDDTPLFQFDPSALEVVLKNTPVAPDEKPSGFDVSPKSKGRFDTSSV